MSLLPSTSHANPSTTFWEPNLTPGTGIAISGSGVITNTGVTSIIAGDGISVSGATGAVTVSSNAPSDFWPISNTTTISLSANTPAVLSTQALGKTYNYVEGSGYLAFNGGTFAVAPTIIVYLSATAGDYDAPKAVTIMSQAGVSSLSGYFFDLSQIKYYDPVGFTSMSLMVKATQSTTAGVSITPATGSGGLTSSATVEPVYTKVILGTPIGAAGFKFFSKI